jgi:hypothetical protein
VRCLFKNLDFHKDHYAVIYVGDYVNGASDNRYQKMMQGTDVYEFEDYKAKLFSGIFALGYIQFVAFLSVLFV